MSLSITSESGRYRFIERTGVVASYQVATVSAPGWAQRNKRMRPQAHSFFMFHA
ncbi:MAG: hypothetical protein IPP22_00750 [Nitrosomonas sp.]|nr:hypothetical protein [Nitrosomonas sp.]